ncbi:MAG: hypothetical protein KDA41_13135, partial [Planctomycetales bacterium]|nr:hypothetical protein [Planctomycetales bacterium]
DRLVELSERANARQQSQNEVIARQSENATELSRDFVAAEAHARQELLTLQQQVVDAEATSREDLQRIHEQIVQRDADGRRELDEMHREAHTSITARTQAVDQQRDLMERERRQLAVERARAPIVAEAVKWVGGLIACLAPLVVVVYLIWSLRSSSESDSAVVEVLVEELVAERPRLLAGRRGPAALPQPAADRADL